MRCCASAQASIFETVLKEIAENARALTGAHGAVITAFDDAGQIDYVTSGLTADEERELIEWPDGLRLFEQLRSLPSPLRLPDLPGYVRSLGFSSEVISVDTFLATSILHRGVQTGSFFVGAKEGGQEFTKEDEEVLQLFAAQAATAIANARAHRDEQRVRADLEALIDISPVGVVVIDAKTAHLISLNREARRIVSGLLDPGQTVEELLQVVTYRLADGQEIALDELPLATVLSNATPLRAEEVVLSVRDGRSITMLINAAPIKFDGGAVESVVVTMAGPGAAGGAGAPASGVPGDGEPRVAGAVEFRQGARRHRAGRLAGRGPGRGTSVLPDHRAASRSHEWPHQRPARCWTDRYGHALCGHGTGGGGGVGGPGAEHVPEQRRPARSEHRPAGGPAAGDGG